MKKEMNRKTIIMGVIGVLIFIVLIVVGCLLSRKIAEKERERNSTYENATRVTTTEEFQDALNKRLNNVYIYGDMVAVEPVSDSAIDGEYAYIKIVGEEYVKYTERKTYTDSDGHKKKKTVTKHKWKTYETNELKSPQISFCGIPFDFNEVDLPDSTLKDTIKNESDSNIRHKYYVINKQYTGTIYADLSDGKLTKDMTFYEDKNIDETITQMQSHSDVFVFWFGYISGIIIFGAIIIKHTFLK